MRFKTGLVIGAAVGFAAAKWLHQDDPAVVKSNPKTTEAQTLTRRLMKDPGRKLTDRATAAGVAAIHRARANVQARLAADASDPTWN